MEKPLEQLALNQVLSGAKKVFEKDLRLDSFGWEQYTAKGSPYEAKYAVHNTRYTPVVNDEEEASPYHAHIIEFLGTLKMEVLLVAFGDNKKITLKRDGQFELENI
jgi:hypothetical protein